MDWYAETVKRTGLENRYNDFKISYMYNDTQKSTSVLQ